MKKVCVLIGTRPEAIKLSPLILALRKCTCLQCHVCVTGQHRELLSPVLADFGVEPDANLSAMREGQSLSSLTSQLLMSIDGYLNAVRPDIVIVQGDTATACAGAMSAFYHKIPIAHVEAGLRSGDLYNPWPEEANRRMISHLACWHFCPTEYNRQNLLAEGVRGGNIYVTGNTVIDALRLAQAKAREDPSRVAKLLDRLKLGFEPGNERRMVLITGHRRENFGAGLEQICQAIVRCAAEFPDVDFVYPVHLNPSVQESVAKILGVRHCKDSMFKDIPNIHLIRPLGYLEFVTLMTHSAFLLTDSGGVQEEAPSIGKPVLVMRERTERPEVLASGCTKLVGANADRIVAGVEELLTSKRIFAEMSQRRSPYGDGHAVERIVAVIENAIKKD